ncbi:MAG: thiamine phosphate synthase [Victivallaceae bacterium]|nr:thiamine phosphate synthase [Victivallaceae bacterium]
MTVKSPFPHKNARLAAFREIDLYPVVSSEFTRGRPVLEVLRAIARGGAKIVQLREKNKSRAEIYELALEYRAVTAAHNMLLIINDHPDIALACHADGVHLGQDDLPLQAARTICGDLLLGASTHNPGEAAQAVRDGADYINIGPIYPTRTKTVACGTVGIGMLKAIIPHLKIPFTVMGGIKAVHIPGLLKAGATRIAMVTEITQAEDIGAKVRELRSLWQER